MFGFVKNYVNKRVNLIKLELTENVSLLISNLIVGFFILVLCFLFLLLLSIGISIYIGIKFADIGLGFVTFSAFYLILLIILICFYSKLSKTVMKKIIEFQLNKKQDESISEDE